MSYQQAALKGFGWQTVLKQLSNGLILLKIMVLSRLLGPTEFGLFSLVSIALGITDAFTQTGINVTIVQSSKPITFFVDTAWVFSIIRGLLISCLMVVLGMGLAQFYQQSGLLFLVTLASLIPLIKGFINPAVISIYKELSFFWDTMYRLALVVIDVALTIALVWWSPGVTTWIVALIGTALFEVVISFAFFRTKPHFRYQSEPARHILKSAKGLSLSSLLGYLNENMDNLLVGKITTVFSLGLYQNSYGLCHKPNYEISKAANHSVFPIFSQLATDPARLRRAFIKTSMAVLGLSALLSLPLLVAPKLIITLVLGQDWLATLPLIRWLTVAGLIQTIFMLGYSYLLATKRLAVMNFHQVITFICVMGLLFFLGLRAGLLGAVIGITLGRALTTPYLVYYLIKYVFPTSHQKKS